MHPDHEDALRKELREVASKLREIEGALILGEGIGFSYYSGGDACAPVYAFMDKYAPRDR